MYTRIFIALVILSIAMFLSTWDLIKLEKFVDTVADASGTAIYAVDASGSSTTTTEKFLADMLNTVFPKINFTAADASSPLDLLDVTDGELIRKYMKNDMSKLMKEEILHLRQLVPVTACAPGGVQASPSLAQGIEGAGNLPTIVR